MEARCNQEISQRNFSFFEMAGFASEPLLAVKAGVAIGYKMALKDVATLYTSRADRLSAAFSESIEKVAAFVGGLK